MWYKQLKLLLIFILAISFIFIQFPSFIRYSVADANVHLVQNGFSQGQSATTATCMLSSTVTAGYSIMFTLDAAFINSPISSIADSLGNTWVALPLSLNSASTWARSWEAQDIAHGGSSDTITVTYTSPSTGSFQTSCAEFVGNINFTLAGGLILGNPSCNTCNLNFTSTHLINYLTGWSDSSTSTPLGFTYSGMFSFTALSGSGTCQQISGSSNCILAFHAESDLAAGIAANAAVTVTCSPACSQTPVFAMFYYTTQLNSVITFTQTGVPTGNNILVINGTTYTVSQLPVSFNINKSTSFTYGYFATVSNGFQNYNWQSLSGCGQSLKDNTFSTSSSCTVTAVYSVPVTTNNSNVIIIAINNQITRFVAYLIPSLMILFIFLWLGIKLNMHGDLLFLMFLLAVGILSALAFFMSGSWVPAWIGIISIVFAMLGFVYYKGYVGTHG